MKIKKIHLEDYKRFHDLTIELGEEPARMVALVGPNGCGKSSVFDAMLFLINAYTHIGKSQITRDYSYHSLLNSPAFNYENVKIEFCDGSFSGVYEKKKKEGKQNTIFSFRSSFRYNGSLDVREERAVSELRKNDYGASASADLDQRVEENYRRLNIKYNEYLNKQDCRPSEAKKAIIGALNDAIKNCLELEISSLGDIASGKGTLFFRKDDTDNEFSYNVLSSGEKEVVDILIDLFIRKDEYDDSIYIIDEPELHLNTAIQRKLLLEINKMIPQNCQLWVATHSIGFLRALQEDLKDESAVIKFDEKNNWARESYVLEPIVKSRSNWRSLFATALDDLTELVSPKRIIYCEGRDIPGKNGLERGLDANVYNKIFNVTHPDTLFVSSGGNTELDQRVDIAVLILSKVFSQVDIWVLKDRDMGSGKQISEIDRHQYLKNNPDTHRILKRFEIENYLYDKEILRAYCNGNSIEFNEDEYSRQIENIVDQNVKDMTGTIKNICGIKSSISQEIFKENLASYILPNTSVYKELEEVIFCSSKRNGIEPKSIER